MTAPISLLADVLAVAEQTEEKLAEQARADKLAAEQKRIEQSAQRKLARIQDAHGIFIQDFLLAIRKVMLPDNPKDHWKPAAIMAVDPYVQALIQTEGDLPEISGPLAFHVNREYAYCVYLTGDKLPSDYMIGQRTEWCQEQVAMLVRKRGKKTERSFKARPPAVHIPSESEVYATSESERSDNGGAIDPKQLEVVREAITPPGKRASRKSGHNTGKPRAKKAAKQAVNA